VLTGWLLVALAGLAIGATSIGGVLVVPALHRWMGMDIAEATALSSQAFCWTGLWALWRLPRLGIDLLRREWVLLLMSLFGAALGAFLSTQVPAPWIRSWIGALAMVSSGFGLWRTYASPGAKPVTAWPGVPMQATLGLLVGIGSALSGTGGPVMLLPLLLLRRCDFERSVQVALVMQVPIALAATLTHASAGRFDLSAGAAVALVLLVGAEIGRRLARRWSQRSLQTATAVLLLATGVWMFRI
jgi:uncharacterized membrane protein YfcA